MLTKYLIGINWVDFLVFSIIARMCYIGLRTGAAVELFKVFSLWLVTVISFHIYTTPLADILNERLPALPLNCADAFVFVVLVTAITILVRIIRESFFLLVKIEAHNTLDKWSGLILGCLRGLWISSIALFIMIISTVQYLEISAKSSLFGHRLINLAPQIYKGSYEGLISKFLKEKKVNDEVFIAIER